MSLLQVQGLGKSFGGNRAVDGISFNVAAGELLARWCQGPRHLEVFAPVPDANTPNTQDTQP